MLDKKVVTSLPYDDAVELCGYGWYNVYILVAIGFCLMDVITETMGMMFIIPAAQCDLELSLSEKSLLSSISFFGVVLSSHLWGFIADTKGRRITLIVSMIASFVTTIISSLISSPEVFIALRFINGFFVGGSSSAVYAYVGEFHDRIYRPKVVSWIACFVAFGNMLLPSFGWLILPMTFSYEIPFLGILFRPWRLLLISYGFIGLLGAICVYSLPESPKFLMTEGKQEETLQILKKIFSLNTGKSKNEYPVKEITLDEVQLSSGKDSLLRAMWAQTKALFLRDYVVKTILVCILQFGAFYSSSGLFMWYPEILNKMSFFTNRHPGVETSMCGAIKYFGEYLHNVTNVVDVETPRKCHDSVNDEVFMISLIIGSCFAVSYVFIGSFINIIGKRRMLLGFLIVTTSFGLASQFVEGLILGQTFIAIFLMEATCIGIINAVVVELYPTQMRGMALAISLMAGRFGAMTGSNLAGPLIYNYCDYTFFVFTADHLILIAIVIILPYVSRKPEKTIQPIA